jgi:hypothetical protein
LPPGESPVGYSTIFFDADFEKIYAAEGRCAEPSWVSLSATVQLCESATLQLCDSATV